MAGIIIGGEGGTGVLMACQLDRWSEPAFYTTGAGSTGLQFGAQTSEAVLVFMTDRTVDAELFNKVKLVAGRSATAGSIGVRTEAGTTTNFRKDVSAYSKSKGLFSGTSLEGSFIDTRESLNRKYYRREI